MDLPSIELMVTKPVEIEIINEPFTCVHRDDDGRALGEHQSRMWTVKTTGEGNVLLHCAECHIKYQQILTRACSRPIIPDTITPLILAHPDWDPAPPPIFPDLPVCPTCGR